MKILLSILIYLIVAVGIYAVPAHAEGTWNWHEWHEGIKAETEFILRIAFPVIVLLCFMLLHINVGTPKTLKSTKNRF